MWDVRLETPKSLEPGSMTLLYRTVGGIRLFHVDHSFFLDEVKRNHQRERATLELLRRRAKPLTWEGLLLPAACHGRDNRR